MEDLYTRAWCLVEYIYAAWLHVSGSTEISSQAIFWMSEAKKFGFYKDKVLITGPNDFSDAWPARDVIFGNIFLTRIMRSYIMFDLDDARSFAPLQMMSMCKVHWFSKPITIPTNCSSASPRIPKRPAHRSGPALRLHPIISNAKTSTVVLFSGGSAKNTGSPPGNPLDMGSFEQTDVFVGALFS